ncbi:hypothetical protein GO755_29830 [Spirosoma sp. HMF4905]|uniref:Uncharacterized protein n=1 Tax=Spirosoma arboris TaxID=2682092 RepID=A0A7K1SKI8_9BACT|nr:hypothetical protein [Spirosoma arboris]MVM34268.1 hypothetical protein [Spirosoma arboris]
MGRNKEPLTGTQKDEEEFAKKVAIIKKIGARKLATYGFLSHESIHNYCRRDRGGERLESLVDESLKAHQESVDVADKLSVDRSRKILADVHV